jgi:ribonuclease HII
MTVPWRPDPLVAGVDEAGRGPLAGPVVAAAVILPPQRCIRGLDDSKALDDEQRERLARYVRERSVAWGLGWASACEIDALNVLQATHLAMRRALLALPVAPRHVRIDGNRAPRCHDLGFSCTFETIVQGDANDAAIAAASILAKTWRDRWMESVDAVYPGYGFAGHKGYGTPGHLAALSRLGPCALHRRTFEPVRSVLVPGARPEADPVAITDRGTSPDAVADSALELAE